MKRFVLALSLAATVVVAGTLTHTTSQLDNVIEMVTDQTAMQLTGPLTNANINVAKIITFDQVTSGALTTVSTNGIITLGRSGTLKLTLTGSFTTDTQASNEVYIDVYLDPLGGGSFADTGFGVLRTVSAAGYGSFAASFHGERDATDEIKIMVSCSSDIDAIFENITVMTEWME